MKARAVYGHTSPNDRKDIIDAFKAGELTALVNVGVLTTGFNAPCIDLMAVMRPTQSAALYVQIMGRGMRHSEGKENCIVLDYGQNVFRHGPINKVKPKEKGDGEAPMKVCPKCATIIALGSRTCPECGYEWPEQEMQREHERLASMLKMIDFDAVKPKLFRVDGWHFRVHQKPGKVPSLRVDHLCGMRTITTWVFVQHTGLAGRKATKWWFEHGGNAPLPLTVKDAYGRTEELRRPSQIEVVDEGKYERVKRSFFQKELRT